MFELSSIDTKLVNHERSTHFVYHFTRRSHTIRYTRSLKVLKSREETEGYMRYCFVILQISGRSSAAVLGVTSAKVGR